MSKRKRLGEFDDADLQKFQYAKNEAFAWEDPFPRPAPVAKDVREARPFACLDVACFTRVFRLSIG